MFGVCLGPIASTIILLTVFLVIVGAWVLRGWHEREKQENGVLELEKQQRSDDIDRGFRKLSKDTDGFEPGDE